MLFNLYIGNHIEEARPLLADIIHPVKVGLEALGHLVNIDDNSWAVNSRVINLFIENFSEGFLTSLISDKNKYGSDFRFGIISTEDLLDPLVMLGAKNSARREGFIRALELADFVWTLVANQKDLGEYREDTNIALFELGGAEELHFVKPRKALTKDIDFLFLGRNQPYREPLFRVLVKYGFSVRLTGGLLPDYYRNSLLERSKIALDLRRDHGVRFTSPSRLAVGINNGLLTIAEEFDESELKNWHNFTWNAGYHGLIDTAIQAIRGDFINEGEIMRQRLLKEKPQGRMAERALQIPFFKGLL